MPKEVNWRLVEGNTDWGQDHELQEETEHEGDEAHEKTNGNKSLASSQRPLLWKTLTF